MSIGLLYDIPLFFSYMSSMKITFLRTDYLKGNPSKHRLKDFGLPLKKFVSSDLLISVIRRPSPNPVSPSVVPFKPLLSWTPRDLVVSFPSITPLDSVFSFRLGLVVGLVQIHTRISRNRLSDYHNTHSRYIHNW